MSKVTILISEEFWEYLNKQKKRGETFEDILKRLIQDKKSSENKK